MEKVDIKRDIVEIYNDYFNSIQENYTISDIDVYKMKQKLINLIDDVIVVEKK